MIRRLLLAAAAAMAAGSPAYPERTADQLPPLWEGRWVVLTTEIGSVCDNGYTNNRVRAGQVDTKKGGWEGRLQRFGRFVAKRTVGEEEVPAELAEAQRFAPGELATVHKVKVRNDRVDLLVGVEGRRLLPYEHGPFTLFREAHCKVQLQFEVPKQIIEKGGIGELEAVLTSTVERYDSDGEGRSSARWNHREDDAYPEDYEDTLGRYAAWRNAEIDRGLREAVDLIASFGARLGSSSGYYDGFFRGVDQIGPIIARRSCERLVGVDIQALLQKPGMGVATTGGGFVGEVTVHDPDGESETTVFVDRQAYEDGQRLLHALSMLERLPDCRIREEVGP